MVSLWTRRVSPTGSALAELLQFPLNVEADTIIRWGTTRPSNAARQINSARAIALAANKAEARRVLRAAGVAVPEPSETRFPVVGRRAKHRAGHGFWLCENEQQVLAAKRRGAVYFSRFYPKTREFRIHIGGKKVLLVSVKEGGPNSPIWNHGSGFILRHIPRRIWLYDRTLLLAKEEAKRAVAALGLDFGAVDVLMEPTDDQPPVVVSEVNTAPALWPMAQRRYVNYFRRALEGR